MGYLDLFRINDNRGRRYDWASFIILTAYLACCDAVAWIAGGPIGGVALIIAILWYGR